SLEKLPVAVRIARKTTRIAKENIALALGIKIGIMVLSVVGLGNLWLAVFGDVGVTIIAIVNALRAFTITHKVI
ncbi:MAG: hypothetical protein IJV62_02865, partial [Eggerthellaceae bacterium]|nr:hypothetical protein [Eggerthellaceae bacterium]